MKNGWLDYKVIAIADAITRLSNHVLISYIYSFIILLIWLYLCFIQWVDNFFKRLNFEIY